MKRWQRRGTYFHNHFAVIGLACAQATAAMIHEDRHRPTQATSESPQAPEARRRPPARPHPSTRPPLRRRTSTTRHFQECTIYDSILEGDIGSLSAPSSSRAFRALGLGH